MFWSDWGKNPNIIMAAVDGSNMSKIVYNTDETTLVVWPNGITLDITAAGGERLYWIDAKLNSVFECPLAHCMAKARVLTYNIHLIKHPYSITVFEVSFSDKICNLDNAMSVWRNIFYV